MKKNLILHTMGLLLLMGALMLLLPSCSKSANGNLSKDQGEQNPEHGDRRNPLLFADVASLQQVADFLIEKELMNLVFTGNDL